ncbi:MAG: ComEC/Rec2 family competence protein [Acidimicrobiia bacterium]|nr:ComEC/Rec2 family competence protein [Acidimicrobiia bacterium]
MTDLQVVALAVLVGAGCFIAFPVPWFVGLGCALVGFVLRSPPLVLLAGLTLGLYAGAAADEAYRPLGQASFQGVVDAVTLPRVDTFSENITVRLPTGERVRMTVSPSAGSVRTVHPGMTLRVVGSVRPIEPNGWHRSQHVVGRLNATSVQIVGDGQVHWRIAAWLQRTVAASTGSMDPGSAALYQGLVTGDDRHQGAAQKAIFRRTGLSHILAVSGQNVAFVLILVHLSIGSLPGYLRPSVVLAALGLFALTTQLEPSVLRATFTAGIGYFGVATGRRASGIRLLAVAVSGLLLVDPFLTGNIGFQLSVLASGGILLLGPAIASRVPGPLSVPVAVTVAAQLAVSPLLLKTFGTVSVVALPANVLTGWAVGLVMMWGMSVGLVAGIIGGSFAATTQLPVRLLLWWIDVSPHFWPTYRFDRSLHRWPRSAVRFFWPRCRSRDGDGWLRRSLLLLVFLLPRNARERFTSSKVGSSSQGTERTRRF